MIKILVTGSNGFIGQHICTYYLDKQYEVYGIDIADKSQILLTGYKQSNLIIDDNREFLQSINPDIIFHCAGNANVKKSLEDPKFDFVNNVNVLYKTLSDINSSGINSTFIFLSSAAVYGNPKILPVQETHEIKPISPYGLHKSICENICLYYSNISKIKIKIARIFSAYGAGLRKQILWDIHEKYLQDERITLFGNGKESRDFIYIDDLVVALDKIARVSSEDKIFNVACGQEIKISQLAEIYAEQLSLSPTSIMFNGQIREGDPRNWVADIMKLKALNFVPRINIDQGVSKYVHWVKGANHA